MIFCEIKRIEVLFALFFVRYYRESIGVFSIIYRYELSMILVKLIRVKLRRKVMRR